MGDCVRRAIQLGTAVGRRMHRWESKSSKDAHYASFGSFLLSARTRISFILRLVGYVSSALTDNRHSGCPGSLSHIRVGFRWLKKGGKLFHVYSLPLQLLHTGIGFGFQKRLSTKGGAVCPGTLPDPFSLILTYFLQYIPPTAGCPPWHIRSAAFFYLFLSVSRWSVSFRRHTPLVHSPLPRTHSLP